MLPFPCGARAASIGVMLLFLASPVESSAQPTQEPTLKQVGRVLHPPIDEMSGIVKSQQYENVWWVHNDSGDQPRLFALDSTGSVHMNPQLKDRYAVGAEADTSSLPPWPGLRLDAAKHVDYEDIALSNGVLYVGDIGNNLQMRRDLGIYVVPEPHFYSERTRPLKYLRIAYPDQETYPAKEWHFDAEGLFVADGRLHLLTKRWTLQSGALRPEPGTTLYRLDTEHPNQVNMLTRVDARADIPPPTAAALSPSGDRLAVLSPPSLWIFPRPDDGLHWLSTEPRRIDLPGERLRQAEAVTWDGPHTLRITNEQRDVFVLSLDGKDRG